MFLLNLTAPFFRGLWVATSNLNKVEKATGTRTRTEIKKSAVQEILV